jgi:hypothetical protein
MNPIEQSTSSPSSYRPSDKMVKKNPNGFTISKKYPRPEELQVAKNYCNPGPDNYNPKSLLTT